MQITFKFFKDTLKFFRDNLLLLFLLAAPLAIPIEVVNAGWSDVLRNNNSLLALFWTITGFTAYTAIDGALIWYMWSKINNQNYGFLECWRLAIPKIPFLAGLYLVASAPIILGLLLLVFPGLYVLSRFSFADIELVLNKKSIRAAMETSWQATEGTWPILLAGYFLITVIIHVPVVLLTSELGNFFDSKVFLALNGLLFVTLNCLYTIFSYRVYYQQEQT